MIPSITLNTSTFQFTQVAPIKSAQELVDEFLKVNHLDKTFQKGNLTPLEMAIELEDLDLCKKVKAAQGGLDPDKPFMESLLLRAVSHSTDSIAIWLIEEEGIDLKIEDRETGFNVLHQAAGLGKIVVAKALIKKGMSIHCISKQPSPPIASDFPERLKSPSLHCTPLFFAVNNRHPQMVRALLQLGADVNVGHTILSPFNIALWNHWDDILQVFAEEDCLDKIMVDGKPILHCFIHTAGTREEDLKKLLSLGANVNLRDSQGKPPIYLAIDLNCLEALKLLVEKSADISAKYHGFTPLNYAFDWDRMDMINYLLEKGADPNIPVTFEGLTLLHYAAIRNNEELANILLRHKAHVDTVDIEGETPLYKTARHKSHQIASWLLENGADPNHPNQKNESPLHCAVLSDASEIARILIERGALIDAQDSEKNMPLHYAQSEAMVDLLLQANANARTLNTDRQTPLECLMLRSLVTDHNFIHLKKKDAGLTENIHKIKLLGHRFSLQSRWAEGFNTQFTFIEIAASWNEFLAAQPMHLQNICKDLSARFIEAAKFKWKTDELQDDSQLVKHLQNQELFILPLGWDSGRHAIVLTMMGRYAARGNRGSGAKEPGLTIFEMKQSQHASAALIKLLNLLKKQPSVKELFDEKEIRNHKDSYPSIEKEFKEKYKADAIQYFNNIFLEGVELKSLCHLQQDEQDSGNCTWMAAKMGLRAALIFIFLKETGDLGLAVSQAKSLYKMWSQFDYERSLKNLEGILQEPLLTQEDRDNLFNALFSKSIEKNKLSWMEYILNARPQLTQWRDKGTAIAFLIGAKKRKTIDWLISHGLDSIVEEERAENVLYMAIMGNNFPLVRYLVEERHCSLAKGGQRISPLVAAILDNKIEIVSYLISKGADLQEDNAAFYALGKPDMEKIVIHSRDCKGRTALFQETLLSSVRKWIQAGMPLDAVDDEGDTVFHYLCKIKEYDVLEEILAHLPNLDLLMQKDAEENTLLHLLADQGGTLGSQKVLKPLISLVQGRILTELLTKKNKKGLSPLHVLLKHPLDQNSYTFFTKIFKALENVDLLALTDNEGNNVMHLCLSQGRSLWAQNIASIVASKTKEKYPLLMYAPNHAKVTPTELWYNLAASQH